jgi:hypothetical protein
MSMEDIGRDSAESIRSIGPNPPSLSQDEKMILGLGIKFIGPDRTMIPEDPKHIANSHARDFESMIQRRVFFGHNDKDSDKNYERIYFRYAWMPKTDFRPDIITNWDPLSREQRNLVLDVADAESSLLFREFYGQRAASQPLPDTFKRGIRSLSRRITNGEIIVTLCDKNLGFVVLNRQAYVDAVLEHLADRSTYSIVGKDPEDLRTSFQGHYITEFERLVSRLDKGLSQKLLKATLSTSKNSQVFKVIIKIHKMSGDFTKLKTRPITPAVGFYTSVLSRFISDLLVLTLPMVKSYVRDATDAAQKLIQVNCDATELFSVTGDIPSMFTNVPMDTQSIMAVIDFVLYLVKKNSPSTLTAWPTRGFLIDAVKLVCKFNVISGPDQKLYLQTEGLAMGTSLAAAFASLSIAAREEMFLNLYGQHFLIWLRFADDIYALSHADKAALSTSILKHFCSDVPKLNDVPWEIVPATSGAIFLDVRVSLCNTRIAGRNLMVTSVYQKELNRYQYLPFYSWHLSHMIRSWVASETQRYARLCFHKQDFVNIITQFKARLRARGYPPHVIHEEINKIDYESVQHETLHLKVKLSDCNFCKVQAAAPNLNLTSLAAPFANPNQSTRYAELEQTQEGGDVQSSRKFLALTAVQPLVERRKIINRLLTKGFNKAEEIAGLDNSRIQIAWKTPRNLSGVFADCNRKSLVQRR